MQTLPWSMLWLPAASGRMLCMPLHPPRCTQLEIAPWSPPLIMSCPQMLLHPGCCCGRAHAAERQRMPEARPCIQDDAVAAYRSDNGTNDRCPMAIDACHVKRLAPVPPSPRDCLANPSSHAKRMRQREGGSLTADGILSGDVEAGLILAKSPLDHKRPHLDLSNGRPGRVVTTKVGAGSGRQRAQGPSLSSTYACIPAASISLCMRTAVSQALQRGSDHQCGRCRVATGHIPHRSAPALTVVPGTDGKVQTCELQSMKSDQSFSMNVWEGGEWQDGQWRMKLVGEMTRCNINVQPPTMRFGSVAKVLAKCKLKY